MVTSEQADGREALRYLPTAEEREEALEALGGLEQSLSARLEGTSGRRIASFTPAVSPSRWASPTRIAPRENIAGPRRMSAAARTPGTRKRTTGQLKRDMPPIPRGCEWRRAEDGWSLWRTWGEWDEEKGARVRKSRYAGTLSDDAWRIMKEYDHETFLSVVGHRLRRHRRG